jgi:uncharacterized membrane protein (DUF441 family)
MMQAIWSVIDQLLAGPFGMIILQTATFIVGVYLLARRVLSPVATGGLAALSLSGAFLFDGALAWVAAALLLLAARDLIHRRL